MNRTLPSLLLVIALAPAAAACGKTVPETSSETTSTTTASAASASAARPSGPLASALHSALLDPSKATDKAPALFKAKFATTKGDFVVEAHRDWAPNGVDRFYNLVKLGFFDDTRFFRAIDGFMVQFGISGDPAVSAKWQVARIQDDPVKQSNKRGFVTFAMAGPNSRTTQIFVNLVDSNTRLDNQFAPFGQVVQGMEVVDALYKGYGEGAPNGMGPSQQLVQAQGNSYLDAKFPKLDGVKHVEIVP